MQNPSDKVTVHEMISMIRGAADRSSGRRWKAAAEDCAKRVAGCGGFC